MSFLNIAFPATSALPVAQVAITSIIAAARPLLGLGIIAAMLIIFKPMFTGMLRAALLVIQPRQNREQKTAKRNLRSVMEIHRVARDFDSTSPSMAAELRAMAARG